MSSDPREDQQKQALNYFRSHADEWKDKAVSANQAKVNVIQLRNGYVKAVIHSRTHTGTFLDVGCGTGDLVCDVAETDGIASTGVDFAAEMIDNARAQAKERQLEQATFYACSIFDFDFSEKRYDVISANGFIEYISLRELEQFVELAYRGLNPGGSLVLGSRNRLFNLFSLNSFTEMELNQGTIPALLREAMAFTSAKSLQDVLALEAPPAQATETQHSQTHIGVSSRFQYSPAELMHLVEGYGFKVSAIHPVHIHGVLPPFKAAYPEVHYQISMLLQDYASLALVPQSSTFMIHAQKVS